MSGWRSHTLMHAVVWTAVLISGCSTSEPTVTSPDLTVSASPAMPSETRTRTASPSPSSSPVPPPLPMIGWGDGRYVVPCLPGKPTVAFVDGRDTLRTSDTITARVVARGELAGYQSVAIHIVCTGASSSPSSVLVYIGALKGPEYVGLALSPDEYLDLKRARYLRDELTLVSYGFTPRAPFCCPDLLVTKTVALEDGELVRTSLVKEPLPG